MITIDHDPRDTRVSFASRATRDRDTLSPHPPARIRRAAAALSSAREYHV